MRRLAAALTVPLAGAAMVHALPALTARGPARRVTPALAGQGRAGGVALTFDDGPDPAGTPVVLETLARLGWRATFFMLGSQVQRHPELARLVVDSGHEVAVHGAVHRNHLVRTPLDIRRDLHAAIRAIGEATATAVHWFRPPYGVLSAGTIWAARDAGLVPVLWTAWGRDWRAGSPARVAADVMSTLREGGTILLHDSDCTSRPGSWRSTVAALPLLAAELSERTWEVRSLGDHLGAPL